MRLCFRVNVQRYYKNSYFSKQNVHTLKISYLILPWNRHQLLDRSLKTLMPAMDNTNDCEIEYAFVESQC
jgi:hypothetical protein